jgi:3'-phosphoadenosine 5'-phosphosulfate sulfotransferase (PAPS reductase)/FAD synthetase
VCRRRTRLSHLRLLEAESIHILREVASEFERPVMLYSIGKDSSVMLRLAQKAFYPGPIPFPLLHIDTGFKFREMLTFRDEMARRSARSCWCGATSRRLRRAPIPLRSTPSAAADC